MSYLVKDYMKKNVPTIEGKASVTEASKATMKANRGFLIVLTGGRPVGIVTEHDFVQKVLANEKNPANTIVAEIMSSPLITIDPDEDLLRASYLMHEHNIRQLPVVKNSIIYGVLTTKDIAEKCSAYVDQSIKDIMKWATPHF